MGTTPIQKDNLRTIISKLIQGDKDWFKEQDILIGDKGPYWVLNYLQFSKNEYNKLTRGLVIRKPEGQPYNDPLELIVSFPFTRFFNANEPEAAPIDFTKSEMIEKMDGSLVGVYFPSKDPSKPEYHTRKMVSVHQPDLDMVVTSFDKKNKYKFMQIIGEYVNKLKFNENDIERTYIFEFIHEASRVLTEYPPDKYGLYLIGGRNLSNHRELTEAALDDVALRIGARRPRRWQAVGDVQQIHSLMDEIEKDTKNFEGAVFRDEKGNRVKLKRQDYVKLHHLLTMMSYKNIIPKVFEGETDEIVSYFPASKKLIEGFQKVFNNYVDTAVDTIVKYRNLNLDRKNLAIKLFQQNEIEDGFVKSLIMRYFSEKDDQNIRTGVIEDLKQVAMGKGSSAGSVRKLMDILKIEEVDTIEEER